jgi:hypothetical protein
LTGITHKLRTKSNLSIDTAGFDSGLGHQEIFFLFLRLKSKKTKPSLTPRDFSTGLHTVGEKRRP